MTSTTGVTARPAPATIGRGQLFIGGKWRDAASGQTSVTVNPATEEPITGVAKAGREDALDAVQAAHAAFENGPWARMRSSERAKIMHRIGDLILENAHELAYREAVDMGKLYTDAMRVDVPHIANMFHYYAGWATKISGEALPVEPLPGEERELFAFTRREPLGVVAAITPFNFPLILSVSKIAPALAAGNTIVHKPASSTPLSALKLAEIIQDAGIPDGVLNTVTGPGAEVGDALATPRWSARSRSPGRPRSASASSRPARTPSSTPRWSWAARARTSFSPTPTSTGPPRAPTSAACGTRAKYAWPAPGCSSNKASTRTCSHGSSRGPSGRW